MGFGRLRLYFGGACAGLSILGGWTVSDGIGVYFEEGVILNYELRPLCQHD